MWKCSVLCAFSGSFWWDSFLKNILSFGTSFLPELPILFIASVGMVKIPLISWSFHKGFFLARSLFQAPWDVPYVSFLLEPSVLCKPCLPWSEAGWSLHLPAPFNKSCIVLGALKSLFSQSRFFSQQSIPVFKGAELHFISLTRMGCCILVLSCSCGNVSAKLI